MQGTRTAGSGWSKVEQATLGAISDALHARAVDHEASGRDIRSDCPGCGSTGRRGRRPVVITEVSTGGLVSAAKCGCSIVELARALDVHPSSLMRPKVTLLPAATREAHWSADRSKGVLGLPANANAWGGSLAVDTVGAAPGLRNLNGIRRVADDLARAFGTVEEGEWKSYAVARAAKDLKMDTKTVRRALRWLVKHNLIEVRQLPAPGEKVVTDRGDLTAKSGVRQYRSLNEKQQIARMMRPATPEERARVLVPSRARQAARELRASLRRGGDDDDLVVHRVEHPEVREQLPPRVAHLDHDEPVRGRIEAEFEP